MKLRIKRLLSNVVCYYVINFADDNNNVPTIETDINQRKVLVCAYEADRIVRNKKKT